MKTIFRICILWLLMATSAEAAPADLPRRMLAETNIARTNPGRYAGYIKEFKGRFVGKAYRMPGSAAMVLTSEGVPALDEAIKFLSRQRPVPELSWSPGLAKAAADLVREQSSTGDTGHDGESSGDLRERIERHGTWTGGIAENIGYGPDTARLMVMELIIDDGVQDRGHRKNIFNSSYRTAGAACGPHPRYRNMCVMEFAVGYKSR